MTPNAVSQAEPEQLEIVREYPASVEDLWELWTTREGIESWWGPDGFTVSVAELDLRTGGAMRYTMTATGAEQVEFMRNAELPLSTEVRLTYTAVRPNELLAYETLADYIPGVEPYAVATSVRFQRIPGGSRMTLRFDRMHDESWTRRARMGRESELEKLSRLLHKRTSQRTSARSSDIQPTTARSNGEHS